MGGLVPYRCRSANYSNSSVSDRYSRSRSSISISNCLLAAGKRHEFEFELEIECIR